METIDDIFEESESFSFEGCFESTPTFLFLDDDGESSKKLLNKLFLTTEDTLDYTLRTKVKRNFLCCKILISSENKKVYERKFGKILVPSIVVVYKGSVLATYNLRSSKDRFINILHELSTTKEISTNNQDQSSNVLRHTHKHDPDASLKQKEISDMGCGVDTTRSTITGTCDNAREKNNEVDQKYCILVLKLFDGRSIMNTFKEDDSLKDVRRWLESERKIGRDSLLGSFVDTCDCQLNYFFYLPSIPRITYSQEEELMPLVKLNLCPRSVLILKSLHLVVQRMSICPSGKMLGDFFCLLKRPLKSILSFASSFLYFGKNTELNSISSCSVVQHEQTASENSNTEDTEYKSSQIAPRITSKKSGPSEMRLTGNFLSTSSSSSGTPLEVLNYYGNDDNLYSLPLPPSRSS